MLCSKVRCLFFLCKDSFISSPRVAKLLSLDYLNAFIKNQLAIYLWVCFWTLCSVPLICISVFSTSTTWSGKSFNFVLFFFNCFVYSRSVYFHIILGSACQFLLNSARFWLGSCQNYRSAWRESTSYQINSSHPWTWYHILYILIF